MKNVFLLLAAVLPAVAVGQQSIKSDRPGTWYPSSCTTNYAMNQMFNLAQQYLGDPHQDHLAGLDVIKQITAPSDAGYACAVNMQWRDEGELDGTLSFTSKDGRVFLHFVEDTASTKKNAAELVAEQSRKSNEFPTRCRDIMPKLRDLMQTQVGDRIGRTIADVKSAYRIAGASPNVLSCFVNVTWENGDVQTGMIVLIKNANQVMFSWNPTGL